MADQLKRTPLHSLHLQLGAKLVPFGGWEMPVQYSGIVEEHRTVRTAVGLFDVSHMGEFEFRGPGALPFLRRLTTNDVAALAVGQVQYSLMCTPDGGIIDDLTLARIEENEFLMTVNAANIDKDWAWVSGHRPSDVHAENVSHKTALLAVQGPRAEAVMRVDIDLGRLAYYHLARSRVYGATSYISRTGYTGEDGFELYLSAEDAPKVWTALLEDGRAAGMVPAGLGARDTLRLEMKYALYGNDIDETTNPIEAGLGWVVKLQKGEFIGRDALQKIKECGAERKLVGFEMVDRAVPRHGYRILREGRQVGIVTSGSYGPSVDKYIAIGYVPVALAEPGSEFEVEVRGRGYRARVVPTPFYAPRVKKR